MAEYIEREALFRSIADDVAPFNVAMVFRHIHNAPAADVAPVVHGRWVNTHSDSEFVQCCLCKYPVYVAWNVTNYCPNCGAKMDGDGLRETNK